MFTYPVYTALKQRLNSIAPVFFYIGQYTVGKTNTSYRAPAIYIEMPKDSTVTSWGKRKKVIKPATVKIHYLSNAPFKNHDNAIQDSAIVAHDKALSDILETVEGKALYKDDSDLLTQQFIHTGMNEHNFISEQMFSVLSFSTEIYG